MGMNEIFPPLSEREIRGAEISKRAAREGMVLLKNRNHVLPLKPDKMVLLGNGAVRTVRGGTGSGDPFNGGLSGGGDSEVEQSPRYNIHILPAIKKTGCEIVNESALIKHTEEYDKARREYVGNVFSVFTFPEQDLSREELAEYRRVCDTAVYVISRNAGEGNDRSLENDYNLTEEEKKNLSLARETFTCFIVILNVGGPISVKDIQESDPDAILLMNQAGQEGGEALADVLFGVVSPSGKLTDTWAVEYRDYPSSETYLSDFNSSYYTEGIYVGYRYFATEKKRAGYPFGYGLSYTEFELIKSTAEIQGEELIVKTTVKNTGSRKGKEVVQVYVSAPSTELDMPYMELRGFEKTHLLGAGEEEIMAVTIPVKSLASYSEMHHGYILSKGYYIIRVGNSSAQTKAVAALFIPETQLIIKVDVMLPLAEALEEKKGIIGETYEEEGSKLPVLIIEDPLEVEERISPYKGEEVTDLQSDGKTYLYEDLKNGKCTLDQFVAQFSEEELAVFTCGTGWGVEGDKNPVIGSNSESVPGAAGETTHMFEEKYGMPSMIMADGPGGVRVMQHFTATNTDTGERQEVYHHCIAWPTGTLLAQTFDRELAREVGLGMQEDLATMKIHILLAPGVNIHRNPLCGRNFEYFSEDPLVAGEIGAALIRGIQYEGKAAACIKHYAANNQETNRHANDSVIGQRALREIYLEPFRIGIVKGKSLSIMTSYNKINSIPSADSYDLCTNLARGEWGFDGLIMTDWNGGSSTPYISMHAGNDLIMPGGETRVLNIQNAVKFIPPQFDERGNAGKIRMNPHSPFCYMLWNGFVPGKDGKDLAEACLGEGHTAEVKGNLILVDGEELYMEAGTVADAIINKEDFKPLKTPVTTEDAFIREDGRAILYKGTYEKEPKISIGDQQLRAKSIIQVMLALGC